jgi:ABC-type glycerol-3-phosphate transport system permease component
MADISDSMEMTAKAGPLEMLSVVLATANPVAITAYALTHQNAWNDFIGHLHDSGSEPLYAAVYGLMNVGLLVTAYRSSKKGL